VSREAPAFRRGSVTKVAMNPGGGPTDDKPDVVLRPPEGSDTVSSFLNVRVADIHGFYDAARAKGAEFLTPPIDRRAELRCYMRDPDGYLIEVGQATGLLTGLLARTGTEETS
jgi:catechol 2,3-dioxygenase-like lactoylglutathione lyase family enzyme